MKMTTDIHKAIEAHDLSLVEKIISADLDSVHQLSRLGDTPLHKAVWQGQTAIAQLLVDKGAAAGAIGNQGDTPLHYAARQGHPELARFLIGLGVETEIRNGLGFTPLFAAARGREPGCSEVAKALLEGGAHLDLHSAVCLGDVDHVRQILESDREAIANSMFKEDLVVDAAIARSGEIINLLVAHGADVNACGMSESPALFASLGTHADPALVATLLRHGANVNAKNGAGKTALAVARRGANQAIIDQLMEQGASE